MQLLKQIKKGFYKIFVWDFMKGLSLFGATVFFLSDWVLFPAGHTISYPFLRNINCVFNALES